MTDEVKKAKKEEELVKVRIIARGEKMALVELTEEGAPKRISIPIKELKDDMVAPSALARGVLYGIPFETLDFPKITAKDIARVMHNYNLWTPDDFRRRPKEVQSAFSELYGETLRTIYTYIKDK